MERRMTLNDNTLKKKNNVNHFEMRVTENKTHSPPDSA